MCNWVFFHVKQTPYLCVSFYVSDSLFFEWCLAIGDCCLHSFTGRGYRQITHQVTHTQLKHHEFKSWKLYFKKTFSMISVQIPLANHPTVRHLNSYSASRDNWCTAILWNRIMTAQCEGMGEVGPARYEPALLPPYPSIRALCYSNCQRSTQSHQQSKG